MLFPIQCQHLPGWWQTKPGGNRTSISRLFWVLCCLVWVFYFLLISAHDKATWEKSALIKTQKEKKNWVWGWGIGKMISWKHLVEFSSLRCDSWMCVRHQWVAGPGWCWNWNFRAWAEQEAFKKVLNTKVLQKSRVNKALISLALRMPQPSISSPNFVSPAGAGGLRTGPALPKWGYLLFKAGELPWDWLIDPSGNDSCPGLLTVTFSPLEKSIPPILAYLLFVKHSWLQVPVKISLAACHFYVQGQINSLHPTVGSLLEKHIFPLFLQEKIHETEVLGCSRSFHPL